MSEFNVNDDNLLDNNSIEEILYVDPIIEKQKQEMRELAKKMRETLGRPEPIILTNSGSVKKASELTLEEQEHEIIKCATDCIYFVETYLTIFDQTQGDNGLIVPFKLFEFQKNILIDLQKNRFNIINKYRQGGISTVLAAYLSWVISFCSNRTIAIVANLLSTAQNEVMFDVVTFISDCPIWLVPQPDKKNTQKLKIYTNGSKVQAFAAKSGVRGITPSDVFIDEAAFLENGIDFFNSTFPALSTGGNMTMVSTPQGFDPLFYKTFSLAKRKENNFNAIELYWYNDPRYNIGLEWVKNKNKETEIRIKDENWLYEKRKKMCEDGWEADSEWFNQQIKNANFDMRRIGQEILCDFLGSGDNFIAEKYLKDIEDNQIKEPIRKEYVDREMWIFEDPNPEDEYLITIDVSAGHGDDSSSISVLKVKQSLEETLQEKPDGTKKKIKTIIHKAEQVAEYHNKVTPQILAEIVYYYAKLYNNAYVVIDVTGGYGVFTIETLLSYGYENIYYSEIEHKQTRERLGGYVKSETKTKSDGTAHNVDLVPGFFIGANRPQVLLNIQKYIHFGDIIIRSVRLLNELKTFINVSGSRIADHRRSFHDDSIMGMAIGLYVLSFDTKRFNKKDNEKTKKMMNAILTMNDINEINKDKPKPIPKIAYGYNPIREFSWVFKGLKGC